MATIFPWEKSKGVVRPMSRADLDPTGIDFRKVDQRYGSMTPDVRALFANPAGQRDDARVWEYDQWRSQNQVPEGMRDSPAMVRSYLEPERRPSEREMLTGATADGARITGVARGPGGELAVASIPRGAKVTLRRENGPAGIREATTATWVHGEGMREEGRGAMEDGSGVSPRAAMGEVDPYTAAREGTAPESAVGTPDSGTPNADAEQPAGSFVARALGRTPEATAFAARTARSSRLYGTSNFNDRGALINEDGSPMTQQQIDDERLAALARRATSGATGDIRKAAQMELERMDRAMLQRGNVELARERGKADATKVAGQLAVADRYATAKERAASTTADGGVERARVTGQYRTEAERVEGEYGLAREAKRAETARDVQRLANEGKLAEANTRAQSDKTVAEIEAETDKAVAELTRQGRVQAAQVIAKSKRGIDPFVLSQLTQKYTDPEELRKAIAAVTGGGEQGNGTSGTDGTNDAAKATPLREGQTGTMPDGTRMVFRKGQWVKM